MGAGRGWGQGSTRALLRSGKTPRRRHYLAFVSQNKNELREGGNFCKMKKEFGF